MQTNRKKVRAIVLIVLLSILVLLTGGLWTLTVNIYNENFDKRFESAYDVTGNDESEGDGVGGLPQGVIDLDYAISFVEETEGLKGLPIGLFGHSWGGYSVCNVLTYHPEVKAVIERRISSPPLQMHRAISGGMGDAYFSRG